MNEWLKKKWKEIGLILLCLNFGVGAVVPLVSLVAGPKAFVSTLGRIEHMLEEDSYALLVIEGKLVDARTVSEVDTIIQGWLITDEQHYIKAIKYISNSDLEKNKLKDRLFSVEIYKAVISYAM